MQVRKRAAFFPQRRAESTPSIAERRSRSRLLCICRSNQNQHQSKPAKHRSDYFHYSILWPSGHQGNKKFASTFDQRASEFKEGTSVRAPPHFSRYSSASEIPISPSVSRQSETKEGHMTAIFCTPLTAGPMLFMLILPFWVAIKNFL